MESGGVSWLHPRDRPHLRAAARRDRKRPALRDSCPARAMSLPSVRGASRREVRGGRARDYRTVYGPARAGPVPSRRQCALRPFGNPQATACSCASRSSSDHHRADPDRRHVPARRAQSRERARTRAAQVNPCVDEHDPRLAGMRQGHRGAHPTEHVDVDQQIHELPDLGWQSIDRREEYLVDLGRVTSV